jgi:hypothetical protein
MWADRYGGTRPIKWRVVAVQSGPAYHVALANSLIELSDSYKLASRRGN